VNKGKGKREKAKGKREKGKRLRPERDAKPPSESERGRGPASPEGERLQKVLSQAGVASRRLSEELHPLAMLSDKVAYRTPAPAAPSASEASPAQWNAWQELLPSRLVGITEDDDGLSYIQLANGNRYYEGSMLKPGVELQRIDRNGLVVAHAPAAAKASRP